MAFSLADSNITPINKIEEWAAQYKNAHLEINHDKTQLLAATPDEAIIVVGPPRLATMNGSDTGFRIVGLVNGFNYSESSAVTPTKAIGSRRHIMTRANGPVQGSIQRMVVHGPNLAAALFSLQDIRRDIPGIKEDTYSLDGQWFANLEEDLYRIPIGLGVIYHSPKSAAEGTVNVIGADYIEAVAFMNRSIGVSSGQAMIFEQMSFMADRVVPFTGYRSEW